MKQAKTIQNFASPGNIETAVTYEVLMAQALAAKEVLLRHAKRVHETTNETIIGVPPILLLEG